MIKPTIGRQVWFWHDTPEEGGSQPEAATVCYVHSDTMVNLQVIDHDGNARRVSSVRLHQGDEPGVGQHCAWMPYQKGQASRHDPDNAARAAVVPVS
jgi:hypothetical protein